MASTFGRSFERAFTPAFQQSANAFASAEQDKMRAAIQQKSAQDARDRAIMDSAAEAGGPVMNPDGSVNVVATAAKVARYNRQQEAIRQAATGKFNANMNTFQRARAAGINAPEPTLSFEGEQAAPAAPALSNSSLPPYLAKPGAAMAPQQGQKPLEQQIREAEEAREVDLATKTSKARAEATAPFENRFTQGDNLAVNGKPVGRAVRDLRTGEYGIMGSDGKIQPIPEGAEPITPTALQKDVPSIDSFRKFKTELTDAERSLTQIERYAKEVGGLNQGIAGLADKFSAGIKTLLGTGKLTPAELSRRLAEGNLQGLLGGNRLAVVGGGVMTEQDAQRIIDYLGGDVNAWQNKEQVMEALSQLYQDRRAQYDDNLKFYNAAVDSYYGTKGFDKREYKDYSPLFQPPAEAAPAGAPQASGLTPEKQARLNELRAKLNQQ